MKIEWDEKKSYLNLIKHGIDFIEAIELFHSPMLVHQDYRKNYGEDRFIGMGYIKNRLMVSVYTERQNGAIRIISLRKANKRENQFYEKAFKN